jgi:hypothetical protein
VRELFAKMFVKYKTMEPLANEDAEEEALKRVKFQV